MKKLLLTLIVALGFCGSICAQQYESHWPGFDYHAFEMHGVLVAAIQIDGEIINIDDPRWDALEVAFFVDDVCRGTDNYLYDGYIQEYGDPFPVIDGASIYYDNTGEAVVVKMYDHLNEIEYNTCIATYLGDPFTIIASDDNDQGYFDPENPVMLNFITETPPGETFTLDINAYTEDGGWYLISSPIGNVNPTNVENMVDGEYDLYAFDQAQIHEEWQNYLVSNFIMETGKGYLYANQEDVTLTFTGQPYEGDEIMFTLVNSTDAHPDMQGWNLVGNPFTRTAYFQGQIPFYVMNEEGNGLILADRTTVNAMEGVFIYAAEDGATATLYESTPTYGSPLPSASLTMNVISNRGAAIDRAIVRFDGNQTMPKFQFRENSTKLYIPMEGKDYAMVNAGEMGEMPVNFKAETNGSYTLNFSSEAVDFTYLHLIDNMTGDNTDLLDNPNYTFNATTTDYASRFRLVFATGSSVDGDSFGFINGAGNLTIFGIDGEATVQIVDVLGHVLSSETFSGSYEKKLDVAPGVYMIRLIQGNDMKVQKMVIK